MSERILYLCRGLLYLKFSSPHEWVFTKLTTAECRLLRNSRTMTFDDENIDTFYAFSNHCRSICIYSPLYKIWPTSKFYKILYVSVHLEVWWPPADLSGWCIKCRSNLAFSVNPDRKACYEVSALCMKAYTKKGKPRKLFSHVGLIKMQFSVSRMKAVQSHYEILIVRLDL